MLSASQRSTFLVNEEEEQDKSMRSATNDDASIRLISQNEIDADADKLGSDDSLASLSNDKKHESSLESGNEEKEENEENEEEEIKQESKKEHAQDEEEVKKEYVHKNARLLVRKKESIATVRETAMELLESHSDNSLSHSSGEIKKKYLNLDKQDGEGKDDKA